MKTVIMPLPSRDFDPSEAAVSWQRLVQDGHRVRFATPDGKPASADPLMLTGEGLDLWGFIPLLKKFKLLGLVLRANADARRAYRAMQRDAEFLAPLRYDALAVADFNGLLLPGGHWSRGMREYLEDTRLQAFVGAFFDSGKPVAAICHGVVLAARARRADGRSALHGKRTTALTWKLESSAWSLMRFLGRFWNAAYYRTYSEARGEPRGYRSVQAEVTRALASPADFQDAPAGDFRKSSGLFRDSNVDGRPAFVVIDGTYVSARWPGDAHSFAARFSQLVARR
ncbi:type 1 glutamine amidotransferase domain-containing protein [Hydrocarboniphaga sp.]|uniref:type 1 glutamine amidotransferase domain-containing protein n=1 Tax=Hydrocarboniphaga sp. TaxID=2033016 RepID=UPI003D0CFECA